MGEPRASSARTQERTNPLAGFGATRTPRSAFGAVEVPADFRLSSLARNPDGVLAVEAGRWRVPTLELAVVHGFDDVAEGGALRRRPHGREHAVPVPVIDLAQRSQEAGPRELGPGVLGGLGEEPALAPSV